MRTRQGNNFLARLQDAPRPRDDLLAGLRQGHVLRLAFDELHPQVLLQLLELCRQGRLADEALLGRTAEMPRIGHRYQVAQVFQLDVHPFAHGSPIYEIYRDYNINRLELYRPLRQDARIRNGDSPQAILQEYSSMLS